MSRAWSDCPIRWVLTPFASYFILYGDMRTKSCNHQRFSIGLHLIWCTKYRREVFGDVERIELKRILAETCAEYGWDLSAVEIMPEHVHLFVEVTPKDRPVDVVRTLKSCSAIHMFATFPDMKRRRFWGRSLWSRGTYYASVGHISEEAVRKYIEDQRSH